MQLAIDPEDERAFDAARGSLLDRFERWLRDERSVDSDTAQEMACDAGLALDWKHGYGDGHLGMWHTDDVREFLLRWCPRKLSVSQADCVSIPGSVGEFIIFLDAERLLAPGSSSARRIGKLIGEIRDDFVADMGNPANFGMAKSLVTGAMAEGVDITDPEQFDRFVADFNTRPEAERRRMIPDSALPGMAGIPGADGLAEDADDADLDEMLSLPPVVMPDDDEVAVSMARAPILRMFARLAAFVGNGRKLTQKGNLTLADARTLVQLLGTGDLMDERFGDRTVRVQSSAELPRLRLIFAWARKAGIIRVSHGKVIATRRGRTLSSSRSLADGALAGGAADHGAAGDLAPVLDRAVDALLDMGPLDAQRIPGRWRWFPQLDEFLDASVPQLLIGPYVAQRPVPIDELISSASAATGRMFDLSASASPLVDILIADGVTDIVDVLELAGVTRRAGTSEPGPAPRRRREGGTVELTPVGLATARRWLTAEGYEAPAAGRFADASAAELLQAAVTEMVDDADLIDIPALSAEVEAWLRRHPAKEAAAQLADAARTLDHHTLRGLALAIMADIGTEISEPFVRELAQGSAARGLARCWLVDQDLEDERTLFDPGDLDSFADVLACRLQAPSPDGESADNDRLTRTLALAGDQDRQIAVIGELWRCPSTATGSVLQAIGETHPVKPVAKAARKALFRWRSQHGVAERATAVTRNRSFSSLQQGVRPGDHRVDRRRGGGPTRL